MQKRIQRIVRILQVISPRLCGRLAFYLFFKPFRIKTQSKDAITKASGTKLEFVVAGNKTYAWHWGAGPVIIMAHGWSSRGLHFRNFIEPLVDHGFTVVIPDFPGHGDSDGQSTNVLEFKETLEAITRHFGMVYGLVGHSLGAMASILLLGENKINAEKLVIFNSAIYSETIINRFLEQIGGNTKLKRVVLDLIRLKYNQEFNHYSTADRVLDITQLPSIMVIGDENDIEVPISEAKQMAQICGGELYVTQGLGHNGGIKNKAVIQIVIEFLAKINRAEPGSSS